VYKIILITLHFKCTWTCSS